jgi:glycosyltransferase involved in cell wall biosynthesis
VIVDFMERRSVELADVVVSPSRYMLEWMERDGWHLPKSSYVAQNLLELPHLASRAAGGVARDARVRELVFFGRLDRRKGLVFFCDVLDRLAAATPPELAVTFLGSVVLLDEPSDELIRRRAARWPFSIRIETDTDRDAAIAYLAEPGRLAVMPSLADNLPCTVHECLTAGIPFLSTDVGGSAELVAPSDRARVLAPPNVDGFAGRLRDILASGQAVAAPSVGPEETLRHWLGWHASLPRAGGAAKHSYAPQPKRSGALSVSVCLAHFERPRELAMMLASLGRQTERAFEIIVADDGSRSDAARTALATLEPELVKEGGALLRLANGGPGAARHAAAERARGEYLLFVDDDDIAEPRAIETFASVAECTGADVLVSAYRRFRGDDTPPSTSGDADVVVPLGPALAAGLIYPELGGTMIFVRREAYFACGGFPRERDVDEDWELLLALVVAGYELQVVPEVLYRYREREDSRSRADNRFARDLSRIRRFEAMLPLELRDLAALAYGRLGGASDESGLRRVERVRAVLGEAAKKRAAAVKKG